MKIVVSDSFFPLLEAKDRYLVLCGGRGSGKSEFAGRKIFYRSMVEGGHRFLVLRKVRKTIQESCVEVIKRILSENKIRYSHNKTERTITFSNTVGQPNQILFDGLDDPEKIKSMKGITSIWMEELTEFSKNDFLQVDLILREITGHYHQIIMTFNPDEAEGPWIKEMFFDRKHENARVHISTVEDNPIRELREAYMQLLNKLDDETYRQIYRFGQWALPAGRIFSWDVVPLPKETKFDEIFYGGDFGYSIDPATLVKIYRKADEYWVEEVFYESGLTNQDIDTLAAAAGVNRGLISYWDAAEPKSIEELCRLGWNAVPSVRGPDSVRAGINYLKNCKIHIVQGSGNIISEHATYRWKKNKYGIELPEPVAFKDHAMSAIRYGIYTNALRGGADIAFFENEIFPRE